VSEQSIVAGPGGRDAVTDHGGGRLIAGLPMYDWPEVSSDIDALWTRIAREVTVRGLDAPIGLTRTDHLETLWRDPRMIVGQVCSLNPVRDGLGETAVLGTLVYDPPLGLPQPEPGSYYSVVVCRRDDSRRTHVGHGSATDDVLAFAGATFAANGTDSQSGYWSLGHFVREIADTPVFGPVLFTGAHRASIQAVASGAADLAAIDVHSWRLALEHESHATDQLAVIGTTEPTPGVVCVVAWELAQHRALLDDALATAVDSLLGTPVAERLHISGYRTRELDEFDVVADRVEAAARRSWHR
jgi:ABC transporter, phosphonate, periplasmic substrate-binding protein